MKKVHLFIIIFLSFTLLAIYACQSSRNPQSVNTGLDNVRESGFRQFSGKRVGIICNHTALDRRGNHIIDLFHKNRGCEVTAIFGPEHGFRGMYADGRTIQNETDTLTGANIYSLYGKIDKPTPEMLANVDVLVYDIQDVGARFYTYITTLTKAMESAAENNIPFVVLDRPNPIRGDRIEGPVLDMKYQSFVGPHPIPIRYGLTIGELAEWINGEIFGKKGIKVQLTVIKMTGWKRSSWYDETGLPWISPSPNMTTLKTAIVYPGFCLLEGTNLSEGRGTDAPFQKFGAPWINADQYAKALNRLQLPGIRFSPLRFTPVSIPNVAYRPKYEDQLCGGVIVEITDRNVFRPISAMLKILECTRDLYPDDFHCRSNLDRLYGSNLLRKALNDKKPVASLISNWQTEHDKFFRTSQKYHLYK